MHVPVTLLALACLTAALVIVREIWPRIGMGGRRVILALAILSILVSAQMFLLGWSTVSPLFNASIRWMAVAGYELILLLFTRLRPRWLTGLTAAVLLLPVLSTSALLPLTSLFERRPPETISLSPNLVLVKSQWDAAGMGNHGVDAAVVRIPSRLPFLRDQVAGVRLYDTQCDTALTSATLDTTAHIVVIHCPASPDHAGDPPHETVVHLH